MPNATELRDALRAIAERRPQELEALLERAPALLQAASDERFPETLLHAAAKANDVVAVRLLLARGADVERRTYATPLHAAAGHPAADAMQLLLAAGARPEAGRGAVGETALGYAVLHGRAREADLLLRHGARPDSLWVAAGSGELAALAQHFAEDGGLRPSAWEQRVDLLDCGDHPVAPRPAAERDAPPFLLAEALLHACANGRVAAAEFLLARGARGDAPVDLGTALHWAAYYGRRAAVELLLVAGADPGVTDRAYAGTPAGWAEQGGHPELGELLEAALAARREAAGQPDAIPIARPLLGAEERAAVLAPLRTGWVVQGPRVQRFEERVAAYTGAAHAIATNSCSTALHLAVLACGVQPGDEVIVPAFTWVATANAVELAGARPVFCDVEPSGFNLDVARAETLVSERTVGIIPVHLFGLCAEMEGVFALAERHGLWVVEDAACALGARIGERHAGTFGALGCFSFHPRKSITTGEGGMLVTGDASLAATLRSLRNHGIAPARGPTPPPLADHPALGFNYRMTDLQGALGCAQMDRLEGIVARRRQLAVRYDELLSERPWLRPPRAPAGFVHAYQAYVCTLRAEPTVKAAEALGPRRDALLTGLAQRGVGTRPGTHAAALLGYYRQRYGTRPEDFPVARSAERLSLALPLYPQMRPRDQERVVSALDAVWKTA